MSCTPGNSLTNNLDVKPDNVLVNYVDQGSKGRITYVQLSDYGSCCHTDHEYAKEGGSGRRAYMVESGKTSRSSMEYCYRHLLAWYHGESITTDLFLSTMQEHV